MVRLFAAGLAGAALATAVQAAFRFTVGTPLAPEQMAQLLFASVPLPLFSVAIELLGSSAKWVAFGAMVALYLAIGAAAAPLVVRTGSRGAPGWVLGSALLQTFVWNGQGAESSGSPAAALGVYLATALIYVGACFGVAGRGTASGPGAATRASAERGGSRRGSE